MTANDQQDAQYGEPDELAKTLHGDKARAEEHEQPADVVEAPADTLIARPGRDKDSAGEGRTQR